MSIKLDSEYLDSIQNFNPEDIFGPWFFDSKYNNLYQNAKPFSHVIIQNFLNNDYAEKIYKEIPESVENWHCYMNPIEVKYAYDDINNLDFNIKNLFYYLSTNTVIKRMSELSNIPDLQYDEYLHGAGLHKHYRYGRLGMHLDYEKHPISDKQRRMNVILYLSKDWNNEEWNGQTELWDKDVRECMVKSPVVFNSAIIFQTNEISYHGIPEPIKCPEGISRKTFAYYYVSELVNTSDTHKFGALESGYRTKAAFIKRPHDPELEQMKKLYEIRPYRRITKEDMENIWPEWTPELY